MSTCVKNHYLAVNRQGDGFWRRHAKPARSGHALFRVDSVRDGLAIEGQPLLQLASYRDEKAGASRRGWKGRQTLS